jgi:ABC-type phosphate/phosphonate transport system substrate-binding protein
MPTMRIRNYFRRADRVQQGLRLGLLGIGLSLGAAALQPAVALAGPKDFVIYTTRLGGDAEQAKPYIDKFAAYLDKTTGWAAGSAKGVFLPSRKEVLAALPTQKPGFGVLEPSLFLSQQKADGLQVLAQVESTDLNTPKLHVLVKNPAIKTLADLDGKKLWTQLADAPQYLNNVVLDGKGDAATRFQLKQIGVATKGIRAVIRGEADATLVDDEQLAEAKKMEGGADLKTVYTSPALPPLLVVSFGTSLSAADRQSLTKALLGMCATATGKDICKEMHITRFAPAAAALLTTTQKRYGQP